MIPTHSFLGLAVLNLDTDAQATRLGFEMAWRPAVLQSGGEMLSVLQFLSTEMLMGFDATSSDFDVDALPGVHTTGLLTALQMAWPTRQFNHDDTTAVTNFALTWEAPAWPVLLRAMMPNPTWLSNQWDGRTPRQEAVRVIREFAEAPASEPEPRIEP